MYKGKKLRKSKEKSKYRESKKMHKKHIFLRVFSKITILVCVFCTISAWAETTTCDINFTPVTGNSWQNSTPTPTNPVEIESVGTKVGNKYAVQIAINNGGGVVDLGTLNWTLLSNYNYPIFRNEALPKHNGNSNLYCSFYKNSDIDDLAYMNDFEIKGHKNYGSVYITNSNYTDATAFKQAMSGVMLYYQRTTDETWTAPTLKTVYLDEPLRKVGEYADVLDYKNGTITRNVGVYAFNGTETSGSGVNRMYSFNVPNLVGITETSRLVYCTHFKNSSTLPIETAREGYCIKGHSGNAYISFGSTTQFPNIEDFKSWLAAQYAAGTPVTVYYPLATPVVEQIENWSCTPPITDIKIATTKMVDEEFAQAEANLAATVQTIESVVSRTIAQTGQIATLQEEKQTRPDENCPANMKCLLVQDEDGTPHWYPIIEP
ncbi:MAG: hypothetical protein KBT14_01480 [Proteobacteria bacterium]|nr:hypothetical protein [Candidatus Enterousia onthequi]